MSGLDFDDPRRVASRRRGVAEHLSFERKVRHYFSPDQDDAHARLVLRRRGLLLTMCVCAVGVVVFVPAMFLMM